MRTDIFHLVYFDYDRSCYFHFYNCNFRCLGCLRKISLWDCHLKEDEIKKCEFKGFLNLKELENVVQKLKIEFNLRKAVLGGGEPTTDKNLLEVISLLKNFDLDITLLTNGFSFPQGFEKFEDVKVTISIKSIDPQKHIFYTGYPVFPILENIQNLVKNGFEVLVETIYIPGFNEVEGILRIEDFIFSIDEKIPLIVDSFLPVPGVLWPKPSLEELEKLESELVRRNIKNVCLRGKTIRSGVKGEVRLIFPH
jgi:pyruvate formate lyase activating enzyme